MRVVDPDTCIGCGACVGGCPVTCIVMNDDSKAVIDGNTCIDCGACEGVCPVGAISAQ